jgi:hypothetical protein
MPDSNVPCPEPIPYSNESYGYADIDFTPAPHPVFDNKAHLVHVDKILSNQLGEATHPIQDSKPLPQVVGSPILPVVGDNNAVPLLSSYAGSEISLPTTLGASDVSSVSVNDIVQPTQPVQPITIKPVPMAPMVPMVPMTITPSKSNEKFTNMNKPFGPENKNNLADFIYKNDPVGKVEHFGPQINKNSKNTNNTEHFGNVKTMDNIVFGAVVLALGYYYVSTYHPSYLANINFSKIPILSQLNDPNITNENKIIIVVAIVVGLVLVSRMLK